MVGFIDAHRERFGVETDTVEAARRLHAEAKRTERERETAASRAATDEGGEA
jgi:hypothetical protein